MSHPYEYAHTLHSGESVIGAGQRAPKAPDPLHNFSFSDFESLGIGSMEDQEFMERAFFFFGFVVYSDVLG